MPDTKPELRERTSLIADAKSMCAAVELDAGQAGSSRSAQETAKLAHELRTPLAAIVALADVMREEALGPLDERYRGYAAGIHESAGHALGVLSSWLGGSWPAAEQRAVCAPLDVNALVAACVSAFEPLALRSGVRLGCRLAPALPQIVADARSLKQVLFNLLANAFAFTPPGGIVTITTGRACAGRVSIEIADTGDGMTADELERVRALASEPNRSQPGRAGRTGYGLPLVFALTSANGGTVDIASAVRGGTRVTVAFPAAGADVEASA